MKRDMIISMTPGKKETIRLAQHRANVTGQAFGVWEHVGLYGRVERDIPAEHTFRIVSFDKPDPPDVYALVACVDSEGV